MMSPQAPFSRFLIALLVVAAPLLSACSRSSIAAPGEQPLQREVRNSPPQVGGAITSRTRVLGETRVNRMVVVEVELLAEPYRELWLDILDNDSYVLRGKSRRVLETREDGAVVEYIELLPIRAGKHYLKMTVSETNGENPSAVVVALPVADARGKMPETPKENKSRIEFKAAPLD